MPKWCHSDVNQNRHVAERGEAEQAQRPTYRYKYNLCRTHLHPAGKMERCWRNVRKRNQQMTTSRPESGQHQFMDLQRKPHAMYLCIKSNLPNNKYFTKVSFFGENHDNLIIKILKIVIVALCTYDLSAS